MCAIFVSLTVANNAASKFQALWAFFGVFCAFVLGVVIVSVRQYRRSKKKKKRKKREKLEEEKNDTVKDEKLFDRVKIEESACGIEECKEEDGTNESEHGALEP